VIWIFAFIGVHFELRNWPPAGFVQATEAFFVMVAIACFAVRRTLLSPLVEIAGGICAAIAIVMPFEMAWCFFNIGPEIAIFTAFVAPFAYVGLSLLFIYAFRK
jgi:hypothetical protein